MNPPASRDAALRRMQDRPNSLDLAGEKTRHLPQFITAISSGIFTWSGKQRQIRKVRPQPGATGLSGLPHDSIKHSTGFSKRRAVLISVYGNRWTLPA